MRAIILAAGEGTRLRPHTLDRPKCLVELAGVPLLSRQLATLETCGVKDVTLVTGYCAQALVDVGHPTRCNANYARTNMVRSLLCAADLLDGSDDVLVTYGDVVYEPRVLRTLEACPDSLCIPVDRQWERLWKLRMEDPLDDAETLRLDASGHVVEIGTKPEGLADIEAQYMGLVMIRADFAPELVRLHSELDDRSGAVDSLDMTSFLQSIVDRGRPLRAVPVDGGWLEVDTTQDLAIYEKLEREGKLSAFYQIAPISPISPKKAESADDRPARAENPPRVWVLADDMIGHTHQCIAVAEALGWPFELKRLAFNGLQRISNQLLGASRLTLRAPSASSLAPPWPDLVLCAGRRPTPAARWIAAQNPGHTRLVQLGRKGGDRVEPFDLVVACAHFGQLPHARRLEVLAPVNRVTDEVLAEAAERWRQQPLAKLPALSPAPIGLLVGGSCGTHRLDRHTAARMGRDVREFAAGAGRRVIVVTSRRTSPEAMRELEQALGDVCCSFYRWRPDDPENPYWGCLALAAALVVSGESESMLGDAAAAGRPLYVYPVPERFNLRRRVSGWIAARARRHSPKGLCARLVARGFVHPPRDLEALHRGLIRAGAARPFGAPFDATPPAPLREISRVVSRIRETRFWVGF